jgi:hypothetical protein
MSSDYRIEKIRYAVDVLLSNGDRLDGDVFCLSVGRFHNRPDQPLDLLNDEEAFLPLVVSDGSIRLVQKAHVAVMATPLPEGDDAVDTGVLGMRVAVTLVDGSEQTGTIFPELHPDRERLIDFLNDTPSRFLALFTTDQLRLVNRVHIAYVRPVS